MTENDELSHGIEVTSYVPDKRYLLEICYDGSGYSGWQVQPGKMTVQEVIQSNLKRLYNDQHIHLIGSSRTDTGVHALGFAATYLAPEFPRIPPEKVRSALNRLMPSSVRIASITEVPLGFHARYDALGKAYTYVLNLGEDTPFSARYSWRPGRPIDEAKLMAGAEFLVGTHDFSSFVVERSRIEEAVRTIYRITGKRFGEYYCITFVGNGFLYKMIRCLMGTLEAVGAGVLAPEAVERILAERDRCAAPSTAPPHGLFLNKVFYRQEELEGFELEGVPFFR